MGQVREFTLPDLGEGLTEATIVRWLVAVGDTVKVDEPVVEVETAKALVDVPCPYGGVVTSHSAEEGAEVPVGAPLLTVAVGQGPGGSGAPSGTGKTTGADGSGGTGGPAPEPEHVGGSGNVLVGYGTQAPPARRRRAAVRTGRSGTTGTTGTAGTTGATGARGPGSAAGPAGPTDSADVQLAAKTAGATPVASTAPVGQPRYTPQPQPLSGAAGGRTTAVISPLVRRLAREHGVDLRTLDGTGPDGLILRVDVERAVAATERPTDAPRGDAGRTAGQTLSGTRIPLRGIRGTAAERLSRSRREIPDASCWVDADATELLAARREMNAPAAHGTARQAVSLLALLGRVCTAALARFPELNSTVDTEAREIVVLPEVHLGFAAQTDRGLVVPVVRNAHTLSAERLTAEMVRLTDAARAGTLSPAELTGGTFTLNNYGVFGVDGSTPIINHPEAAMLGVGRIARKPWVVGDELAVRDVVQLSLTFDHRVCDGGTAGGFLRHVADCVERPAVLLRTL
ncbi:dihydrolipoamide acetyltransferase family protein [Streptomyces iconiensis]|uniref:Dihydrolipoamide acetyltransferase component of pyruvate dehydrogenase complex n=1 Tax=Streptomyces iconiensis TaxID=1384038 RepID=A0ABT6ZRV4_9ACTN|nr:dihydrolipoamide acetyltransferase family protein [Streptomyces iconiensis]MDJ1131592.1 dihydrolipoamide acetyltransferase family protein [Streptomyces iconiensis]